MVVVTHPTGNANVRAVCSGLAEAHLLTVFHTTIASFEGGLLDGLGALKPLSEIRRRRLDTSLKPFTQLWPWREVGRLLSSKVGLTSLLEHEVGPFSVDAVYRSFDHGVASTLYRSSRRGARAVYAYEDGAAFSFQAAKKLKLECLYDLPIGYWRTARQLLETECDRWPEWASTLTGFKDSIAKLARKDEELQLADQIFVASQFTARTLRDYPGPLAPVHVIPYGFPPVTATRNYVNLSMQPLKLLFVGGLSQRKGIANLFAAVEPFGRHVELTIVGQKTSTACAALDAALLKHQWIPSLPHNKILQLMREQDVLVFPSLFEGFGLVITEAMSQGTPVITTDRTAGPDLIEHGRNGWLVEAGSTDELIETIEKLRVQPKLIAEAGQLAIETAKQRPWTVYSQQLAEAIASSTIYSKA